MNTDLKQREADLIAEFDKIKATGLKKERELAEIHEELIRLQGAMRLLKELMAKELAKEEEIATEVK